MERMSIVELKDNKKRVEKEIRALESERNHLERENKSNRDEVAYQYEKKNFISEKLKYEIEENVARMKKITRELLPQKEAELKAFKGQLLKDCGAERIVLDQLHGEARLKKEEELRKQNEGACSVMANGGMIKRGRRIGNMK